MLFLWTIQNGFFCGYNDLPLIEKVFSGFWEGFFSSLGLGVFGVCCKKKKMEVEVKKPSSHSYLFFFCG